MKKILVSISTFLLVSLTFYSFQPELASATGVENTSNLIEPLGAGDDARFCSGTFYSDDAESYVTIQTNTSSAARSVQWGFHITPRAYKLFEPRVQVSMTAAFVNGRMANSPYAPHTNLPSYNFHGSMKNYQVAGKNNALKSGDKLNLHWRGVNVLNSKNNTGLTVICTVK